MLEKFKQNIFLDFPDFNGRQIYLAISGGKDSMCLSKLLLDLNIDHTLLHCNFQLRGEESDQDEKFLVEYAKRNNLTLEIKKFNTEEETKIANANTQLTARNLRYKWFKKFCSENSLILTAHHQDDNIETFLINLLRGTGLKGATGIPKIQGQFYRPLLDFKQEEIENFILHTKTIFRTDSSNKELKYRRNKIRNELIPQLESFEPNVKTKISSYLKENKEIQDFIDRKTLEVFNSAMITHENYIEIPLSTINSIDAVLTKNFFSKYKINRAKFNEFETFLSANTGAKFQSISHNFIINRGSLLIQDSFLEAKTVNLLINKLPWALENRIKLQLDAPEKICLDSTKIDYLDFNKLTLPFKLRSWKNGDKILPLGMSNYKLVSDILIDKKVNQFDKNRVLILENSDSELISIIGFCISEIFKVEQLTKSCLSIHF